MKPTQIGAVRDALATYRITEPCAIDNEPNCATLKNDQGYVPAYYLFDAEGKLRSFAAGERGLDLLKATLDRIMGQAATVAAPDTVLAS